MGLGNSTLDLSMPTVLLRGRMPSIRYACCIKQVPEHSECLPTFDLMILPSSHQSILF